MFSPAAAEGADQRHVLPQTHPPYRNRPQHMTCTEEEIKFRHEVNARRFSLYVYGKPSFSLYFTVNSRHVQTGESPSERDNTYVSPNAVDGGQQQFIMTQTAEDQSRVQTQILNQHLHTVTAEQLLNTHVYLFKVFLIISSV